MVTDRARIDSLEAGRVALDAQEGTDHLELVVSVRSTIPPWLIELVVVATARGSVVLVEAEAPPGLPAETLAGWEIGVCTAALTAGAIEVFGIAPSTVARVREVIGALAAAASDAADGGPAVQPAIARVETKVMP